MKAGYKRISPEEQELEKKRKEFYSLERRLSKLEHDLYDLREEVEEFARLYTEKMADRLAELDTLKNELSALAQEEEKESERVWQAQNHCNGTWQWQESDAGAERASSLKSSLHVPRNGGNLKEIYRKVAKVLHPDLVRDESERKRRQKLMAEANRAYAEEDRLTLLALLDEWVHSNGLFSVSLETEGNILIRRIARIAEQIIIVEAETTQLKNSDMYRLIQRVKEAKWRGRDVLTEMMAKLDADILFACKKLNEKARMKQQWNGSLRMVSFYPDKTIGTLFVRNGDSRNFLDWRKLGEAIGEVAVPTGKSLRLDVKNGELSALDLLSSLKAYTLQAFYLNHISDAELAHVLRFKEMQELFISGVGITGGGLIHLLELKGLERLYLYDTSVDDSGLICLKYLSSLKYLTLCNGEVSEAGLNRLQETIPQCNIVNLSCRRS